MFKMITGVIRVHCERMAWSQIGIIQWLFFHIDHAEIYIFSKSDSKRDEAAYRQTIAMLQNNNWYKNVIRSIVNIVSWLLQKGYICIKKWIDLRMVTLLIWRRNETYMHLSL